MTNKTEFYDAKISVRSQMKYLSMIKGKLQPFEKRYSLFRNTVFGRWLDIPPPSNDNHLLNYVLQHQVPVPQKCQDCPPIIYKIGDHQLHFGRREFCLITGFRCGQLVSETFSGQSPFCNRVFPNKGGSMNVKGNDLLKLLKDEKRWSELTDEDVVRVCLLLVAEVVFRGRESWLNFPGHILTLVEDFVAWDAYPWGEYMWSYFYVKNVNVIPNHALKMKEKDQKKLGTYNLNGFVWALKIWILESYPNSSLWWVKQPGVIPRCLAWSNKQPNFKKSDHDGLFLKAPIPILDLDPTVEESEQAWWIDSLPFFRGEVRPIVQAVQGEVAAVEGFEEDRANDDIPVMQYEEEQKENGEVSDLVKEKTLTSSLPPNDAVPREISAKSMAIYEEEEESRESLGQNLINDCFFSTPDPLVDYLKADKPDPDVDYVKADKHDPDFEYIKINTIKLAAAELRLGFDHEEEKTRNEMMDLDKSAEYQMIKSTEVNVEIENTPQSPRVTKRRFSQVTS